MSFLEHDAENCARLSDDIMLYLFDLDADSNFRPVGLSHQHLATPKMPCNCRIYRASNVLGMSAINLRNVDITLR
ncbi:hypothetical protein ELG69_18910 [Rhizobium leguminosarum]|nr:hypothetical protein ELG85_17315 [Rhizobium leguminosarum]TBG86030.1 hypothetical protein ELG69_18910 [Rhizobium leguminosarum]